MKNACAERSAGGAALFNVSIGLIFGLLKHGNKLQHDVSVITSIILTNYWLALQPASRSVARRETQNLKISVQA